MNGEQITAFLQAHWEWVTLIMGIVSVVGSILNCTLNFSKLGELKGLLR